MKTPFKILLFALTLTMGKVMATTPVEVLVPVDNIYEPKGFDSNDNTEVIITGYLPNLCYKSPKAKLQLNDKQILITVTSLKNNDRDQACPEVIVPFLEKVNLGILQKGDYQITANGKSPFEHKGLIHVAQSQTTNIDDFIYANVEYIEKKEGSRIITLKGEHPSDCFIQDETVIVNNGEDTYSILPKIKRIREICPRVFVPFAYEVEIPTHLNRKKVLLHVRKMDGNSVNTLFYNP